jgi:hypothetical protein
LNANAQITVKRGVTHADRSRAYEVKIDGKVVGRIRAKELLTVQVPSGSRSLTVQIDWCGSRAVDIDLRAGQHEYFECGNSLTGWRLLRALIFRPNSYLWLRRSHESLVVV